MSFSTTNASSKVGQADIADHMNVPYRCRAFLQDGVIGATIAIRFHSFANSHVVNGVASPIAI